MIDYIEQIRKLRKNLSLTQKDLAKASNVSQSLIAKIESGNIDPSYSNIQRIMDALNSLNVENKKKASDVMVAKIIKLSPKDTLINAIKKMKKFNISQIPVFEDRQVVGLISDMLILNAIADETDSKTEIGNIMSEAPPIISPEADLSIVTNLLRQFPLVIVSSKGTPKGIITKADMFNSMF